MTRRLNVTHTLVAVTILKLALTFVVGGTSDVKQRFDDAAVFLGGRNVLDPGNTGGPAFFMFGHFAISVGAYLAAAATGLPFKVWIKLPAILSDLAVSILFCAKPHQSPRLALAYMLNPVTLLLSVYHGQLHSVAVAAAVWSIQHAVTGAPIRAAVALALAASVRQNFGLLIGPLLMRVHRQRIALLATFGGLMVVLNAPILLNPLVLRTLDPASTYGIWGYAIPALQGPRVFALMGMPTTALDPVNRALQTYGAVMYPVWIGLFLSWLWRRPDVELWKAALVLFVSFYAVTPKFGVQWLIWALPFWLVADFTGALIYSALGAAYLASTYWVWTFNAKYGVESITANLGVLSRLDFVTYLAAGALGMVTWLYCVQSAWRFCAVDVRLKADATF